MNDLDTTFREVTKDRPCEICGRPDWCRRYDDGRIECHRPPGGDVPGYRRLKIERTGGYETQSKFSLYRRCDDPIFSQKTHRRPVVPRNGTARTVSTSDAQKPATNEAKPKSAAFESVADYEKSLGDKCGGGWIYHGADGLPALAVVRINKPEGGKEFRPLYPVPGGWAFGDPPGKLPLYRLPELATAGQVIVVEGERCADAAASIGLTATTSSHGSSAPGKTDWTPLAGHDVAILVDNDQAGRNYGESVARILTGLTPPAHVRVVDIPGLPDGGDIVEWLDARECVEPADLRRELRELIDATPYYTPTDNAPATDSLPDDPGPPWVGIAEIGDRPAYKTGLIPVSTGSHTLDEALGGGLRPETMTVLAGRTGFAKSTTAANIVRWAALAGHSVLYFALEESIVEKGWRIHSAASRVAFRTLLNGSTSATQAEKEALADGWQLIRTLPIRFSDCRNLDSICRTAKAHAEQGGKLIVIDQLSMIHVEGADVGYQRATIASNRLRVLAVETHLPILLVAQVGREASKSRDRLTANSLRDSGELENDSACVLMIDKVREIESQWRASEPVRDLEIIVAKNRYGPTTHADDPLILRWYPRICRIEEPAQTTGGHPH